MNNDRESWEISKEGTVLKVGREEEEEKDSEILKREIIIILGKPKV